MSQSCGVHCLLWSGQQLWSHAAHTRSSLGVPLHTTPYNNFNYNEIVVMLRTLQTWWAELPEPLGTRLCTRCRTNELSLQQSYSSVWVSTMVYTISWHEVRAPSRSRQLITTYAMPALVDSIHFKFILRCSSHSSPSAGNEATAEEPYPEPSGQFSCHELNGCQHVVQAYAADFAHTTPRHGKWSQAFEPINNINTHSQSDS
jgi:hypothetical protein